MGNGGDVPSYDSCGAKKILIQERAKSVLLVYKSIMPKDEEDILLHGPSWQGRSLADRLEELVRSVNQPLCFCEFPCVVSVSPRSQRQTFGCDVPVCVICLRNISVFSCCLDCLMRLVHTLYI